MAEPRPVTDECPYCGTPMRILQMGCSHCQCRIDAPFPMSRLARMPVEHQRFVEMFVLSGGNLKELAAEVGVSYPTIRARLDRVIDALRAEISKTQRVQGNALDALSDGPTGALRMIKDI
jgi:hypothetical protein